MFPRKISTFQPVLYVTLHLYSERSVCRKYSLIRSGVIYALVLRSSRGLSLEKMQPCLELTPDLLALANWRLFERQLSLPAALIFEIDTCFRLNENSPSRNENNATCRANHSRKRIILLREICTGKESRRIGFSFFFLFLRIFHTARMTRGRRNINKWRNE